MKRDNPPKPFTSAGEIRVGHFLSYLAPVAALVLVHFYAGAGADVFVAAAVWLGGFLFWTLVEYLFHRFLYHPFGPHKSVRLTPFFLLTHGRHHRLPGREGIGFLPVWQGYPFLLLLGGFFYLLLGSWAFLFLSGFILGYSLYTLIHYAIHRLPPPFGWLAPLWRHHQLHHAGDPHLRFGVTTTWWDRLLGTLPPED